MKLRILHLIIWLLLLLVGVGILGFVIFVVRQNSALKSQSSQADLIACQLSNLPNRTLFTFPTGKLVHNDCCGFSHYMGPFNFSLPAGNYSITVASYDSHAIEENDQMQEQYQIKLLDEYGMLFITAPTSDLPRHTDYIEEAVNSGVVLNRSVSQISVQHISHKPNDINPQSIQPICVAFDRV